MIILDNNYRINTEDNNNCILEFFEIRTKNKDTEKEEQFEYVEQYYYSSVQDCLEKYLQLAQKEAKDIKDCIRITEETIKRILNLKLIN